MGIYSINQNRWSFASGEFSFRGNSYVGLQSFNPKESVKKEKVRGSGRTAVGRVRGEHEASINCEMLLTEFDQLIHDLGDSFTDVPFDASATYSEPNGDGEFHVGATQVTIVSIEKKASNDGKAIVVALELDVIEPIDWNGVRMAAPPNGFDPAAFGLSVTF